ncbi:hypothetical protein MCOR27_004489 [Pyricularia oryzae]|uniref:Tetrapyrrole biosynthesis uroporphyrinogen III synthase domain-containing protein n=5 Tax=Pyricularia TaxID=48558 RepID=A0ABQ8NHT2_PYRGI|nr:uncharacterized protein MGG_09567 [Pyricularia oryzae 70-15]ELQ38256.1 uroporphyrinogen-III synthase [Pyricularia oryzae Y34]KAH8847581.1 hypothetical protein MCOR01_000998 [Pyricularia oryzae]KAI6297282.1 hypothetical protein MCOR33_006336 [Pyricularia grisea]EHA52366.1 hypothetical protein MGG_09567 [Pyricularia oryzae 70-15]KAH9430491.1 hypothetical protein MCOR02_010189 [Pyricularia oryzae]
MAYDKVPVLLLKTKSTPVDAYEEIFSQTYEGNAFEPIFIPVLEHRFLDNGMKQVRAVLKEHKIGNGADCQYGGMIFTSQRAVEAFAHLVTEGAGNGGAQWPNLQDIPIYSVGPATTRALKAIPQEPALNVYGEHAGNGETLAPFILDHYGEWYKERDTKPPLLFLTGEVRRDIIPKVLMDSRLAATRRIQVDEVVVYGTGVMHSFEDEMRQTLDRVRGYRMLWAVVFSPTGCDSMLRALGFLKGDGKLETEVVGRRKDSDHRTLVATIGPTTRAHLADSFQFEPDVCSEHPSPDGVWSGITKYISNLR